MKINDIKVGEEYGVSENPQSRYYQGFPRRVRVLSVEKRPTRWGGNVVRVPQVDVLDAPPDEIVYGVERAEQGEKLWLPARHFLDTWDVVEKSVRERRAKDDKKKALQSKVESRLTSLGFDLEKDGVAVHTYGTEYYGIQFLTNDSADKILDLAEAGQASIA